MCSCLANISNIHMLFCCRGRFLNLRLYYVELHIIPMTCWREPRYIFQRWRASHSTRSPKNTYVVHITKLAITANTYIQDWRNYRRDKVLALINRHSHETAHTKTSAAPPLLHEEYVPIHGSIDTTTTTALQSKANSPPKNSLCRRSNKEVRLYCAQKQQARYQQRVRIIRMFCT